MRKQFDFLHIASCCVVYNNYMWYTTLCENALKQITQVLFHCMFRQHAAIIICDI
jgi:hypothetical protein